MYVMLTKIMDIKCLYDIDYCERKKSVKMGCGKVRIDCLFVTFDGVCGAVYCFSNCYEIKITFSICNFCNSVWRQLQVCCVLNLDEIHLCGQIHRSISRDRDIDRFVEIRHCAFKWIESKFSNSLQIFRSETLPMETKSIMIKQILIVTLIIVDLNCLWFVSGRWISVDIVPWKRF